jgi:nitrile hydratase
MPALPPEMVPMLVAAGASARIAEEVAATFKAGDAVVVKNLNPLGHTRIPRYVKGKRGVVRFDHGVFAFPDTNAHGAGHSPQHVYSVRFTARDLWGDQANDKDSLHIDLFDAYLEKA